MLKRTTIARLNGTYLRSLVQFLVSQEGFQKIILQKVRPYWAPYPMPKHNPQYAGN